MAAKRECIGNQGAVSEEIYAELKALAAKKLRHQSPGHSLSPSALVNEAYLKLQRGNWNGKTHFKCLASNAMRQVLVDHARKKGAQKRGGDRNRVTCYSQEIASSSKPLDLLILHDALERLAKEDPIAASVVELRFFGGLTVPEVAISLDSTVRTVERKWTYAKAYLLEQMQ